MAALSSDCAVLGGEPQAQGWQPVLSLEYYGCPVTYPAEEFEALGLPIPWRTEAQPQLVGGFISTCIRKAHVFDF